MQTEVTTAQVKDAIRNPFAFPGGYQKVLITDDGEVIHAACAREQWYSICHSMRNEISDGYRVVAIDINWESEHYCAVCGDAIESEYSPES